MKKIVALLMITALLITGCGGNIDNTSESVTANTTKEETEKEREVRLEKEAQARAKAEEEAKKKAEEEARIKAEEEAKRLAALRERTYYATKKTAVYEDDALTVISSETLSVKAPILTKKALKDEAGNVYAYEVESIAGKVQSGYIKADSVLNNLSDFIARPHENVDYGRFERRSFKNNPPVKVKGLYVTQHTARSEARMDDLIKLANETEINAFVIDVKEDNGNLLFYSETAQQIMPELNDKVAIKDIDAFMKKLKDNNIYTIARIVTFKSPQYAVKFKDRAITYKDGRLFKKSDGIAWVSAYDRQLWDYTLGICKETAAVGFNEIQFDYVRFPVVSRSQHDKINYHNALDESKTEVIHKFLRYAYTELEGSDVYITADIFGWSGSALGDEGIGQHWESMANAVDYVAPMMYPSHYGSGNYGLKYPDTKPYQTIDASIKDIIKRNENLETQPINRPWIQDFTAKWLGRGKYIPYGAKELRAQIQALKDNGVDEYMVWNPLNRYSIDAFDKEEE